MTVLKQQPESHRESDRWYASCSLAGCGVCGPLRSNRQDAKLDDSAHNAVCAERKRRRRAVSR